jgi:YHS domain-containing protein
MISAVIREFVIPLLIFLLVRSLLRGIFAGARSPTPRRRTGTPPSPPSGGVLHKDPVCGTYVSGDTGIVKTVGGQTVYFCSAECRDKYAGSS